MVDQIVQDLRLHGWSYQRFFFKAEILSRLNPLFSKDFVPAKIGKGQAQRNEEIRGDWTYWLDPLNPPIELVEIFHELNNLKIHLNQQLYLGLKDFECHLARYPVGSFYKKHSDRFEEDSSRSLSFIFYLHQEWNEEDGGELVLYNQQNEVIKTILPEPGAMILFLSKDFPHEVKVCRRERRSLTGWMHTKLLN